MKTTVDFFTELVIESNKLCYVLQARKPQLSSWLSSSLNKLCDALQARIDLSIDLLTELIIKQNKLYQTQ